jgi:DNA-binding transcriptional LysR family regulator
MAELRHLRAVVAVADEGGFTAAADRLFLSQQQLSRQVAQLEDELGVQLFQRTTRRVELTAAGERMLAPARRAVRSADAAFAAARGETTALRVDISSGGLETGALILERLRQTAPQLEVHQIERGVRWGIAALQRGELDVLLGDAATAPPDVASRLVRHEPLLIGMGTGHPLAGRDAVPVTALRDVPLLLPSDDAAGEWNAAITGLCREAGFVPRRHPGVTHGSVAAAEVLRGDEAVTPTVPWREPPPDLVFRPLDPPAGYPMSAMWIGGDPAVQAFLAAAEALAGERGWRAVQALGDAAAAPVRLSLGAPSPMNATAAPSSGRIEPMTTPPRRACT